MRPIREPGSITFSTGWAELGNYWGRWPFESTMYAGSENMFVEVAVELGKDHEVTARLPYEREETVFRGVRWVGLSHPALRSDVHFAFDDFDQRDRGARTLLVATRSDPPRHDHFDEFIFYSRTHARAMGHATRPSVGGGVRLADYETPLERLPQRVICTGSPDRCYAARLIGRSYDFVHSYRSVPGMPPTVELSRPRLLELQQTAQVLIHPCDPVRPAEWFSMAILEAMAAGTPCIISDADALPELWSEAAIVLPRPIDYSEWVEQVDWLLEDPDHWRDMSEAGKRIAAGYDWPIVARKFMEVALNGN